LLERRLCQAMLLLLLLLLLHAHVQNGSRAAANRIKAEILASERTLDEHPIDETSVDVCDLGEWGVPVLEPDHHHHHQQQQQQVARVTIICSSTRPRKIPLQVLQAADYIVIDKFVPMTRHDLEHMGVRIENPTLRASFHLALPLLDADLCLHFPRSARGEPIQETGVCYWHLPQLPQPADLPHVFVAAEEGGRDAADEDASSDMARAPLAAPAPSEPMRIAPAAPCQASVASSADNPRASPPLPPAPIAPCSGVKRKRADE
jgi:hypothetical protein